MKRFKNILLFQGKNEAKSPLLKALHVAETNHAKLKIVDVLENLPEKVDSQLRSKHGLNFQSAMEREFKERVKRLMPRKSMKKHI